MKTKFISTTLSLIFFKLSFCQITTTKVINKEVSQKVLVYDSTKNFLGNDVFLYKGQELYLIGRAESLRKYGYDGFVKDYKYDDWTNKTLNIYQCCDGYNSKYEALKEKYFKVLDIVNHPKSNEDKSFYGSKYYLKLEEKESKDIVYYQYDSQYIHSFPFIVVGYFEKSKRRYIGEEYVLRGRNWIDKNVELYDIKNGKPVDFSAGTIWKCVDFSIEEKYYELSLIIENDKGEQLAFSMDNILKGTFFAFSKNESDKYKQKFGVEKWGLILNGKVKVGMTKEMCELSWGKPKSVNETITSGNKSEQWVYSDNYLYFDNGILTAIQ